MLLKVCLDQFSSEIAAVGIILPNERTGLACISGRIQQSVKPEEMFFSQICSTPTPKHLPMGIGGRAEYSGAQHCAAVCLHKEI